MNQQKDVEFDLRDKKGKELLMGYKKIAELIQKEFDNSEKKDNNTLLDSNETLNGSIAMNK